VNAYLARNSAIWLVMTGGPVLHQLIRKSWPVTAWSDLAGRVD